VLYCYVFLSSDHPGLVAIPLHRTRRPKYPKHRSNCSCESPVCTRNGIPLFLGKPTSAITEDRTGTSRSRSPTNGLPLLPPPVFTTKLSSFFHGFLSSYHHHPLCGPYYFPPLTRGCSYAPCSLHSSSPAKGWKVKGGMLITAQSS
jgi:hypothetical protein